MVNHMHIGIVGPISTEQLKPHLSNIPSDSPAGLGGIPVNNLIIELLKRRRKLSVFSLSPDVSAEKSPIILQGNNLTVYYGPFRPRARSRMIDFFKVERAFLKSMLIKVKPDIIHAHWQYEWGWAALDSGIPMLLTCHDSPIHILKANKNLYRLGRLVMGAYVLRRARNLTAVSPYTARGIGSFSSKEVDIVSNFEPNYIFDMYKKRTISRPVRIAMVNNGFGRGKNIEIGIKAFSLLRQKISEVELFLFGHDFGPNEKAETWVKQNNLTSNVHFKGYSDFNNLIKELNRMDIFLLTSIEESCPMVLLEATALGIPVIAGKKSGGIPWVLEGGAAGILVDVRSEGEVAEALWGLISDPQKYQHYSLAGRENAEKRFTAKVVVDQYESLYEKL